MHGLNTYDYGARQHDPILARWDRMDPLCEKYYSTSPYAYCANNPIMLIDTDGREWKYSTDDRGNIHISVDIKLIYSGEAKNLAGFETALSTLFNEALSNASNGKVTGEVTYSGAQVEGKVTPEMYLNNGGGALAGFTTANLSNINIADRNGKIKDIAMIASDALHELFHTVNLHHLFDKTDAEDTQIEKTGKDEYKTTEKTAPNILYNVMNYQAMSVDGKKANGTPQSTLTNGQIQYILRQIDLQQQGAGLHPEDPYWQDQ